MKIRLETAKNASVTCTVDGRFLHSKYNPENEAKNFVDSIECSFSPSCIIILGACLPYCNTYLLERFPDVPLYAVSYASDFLSKKLSTSFSNQEYTKQFICDCDTSSDFLSEEIYSALGEITLHAALVITWKVSDEVFQMESSVAWDSIRYVLQKSRDVLATRSYFSLRWLKNCIHFCTHATHFVTIQRQSLPILLVASGPSLDSALPIIKKNMDRFFILSLSSSLKALVDYGIIPDMCMSTDGGYYAKSHIKLLECLSLKGIYIPLAVTPESNVSTRILKNNPIVALTYNDGLESSLLERLKIPAMLCERNGSVSGTASSFALSITDKNVYAVGLDLCNGKGYTHSKSNAHEVINSLSDYRLSPLSSRVCKNVFASTGVSALSLYRQWFETRDSTFAKRFYRARSCDYVYEKKLGVIKDICLEDVVSNYENENKIEKVPCVPVFSGCDIKKRKENLLEIIIKEKNNMSTEWIEDCAFSEYLLLKKYPASDEHKKKLRVKLEEVFNMLEERCR